MDQLTNYAQLSLGKKMLYRLAYRILHKEINASVKLSEQRLQNYNQLKIHFEQVVQANHTMKDLLDSQMHRMRNKLH